MKDIYILGIETSCDETSVSIVKNGEEEIRISILEFQKQAHFLLTKLKEKTNATFSIPEYESAASPSALLQSLYHRTFPHDNIWYHFQRN
mgnify:CR=1 FL=1